MLSGGVGISPFRGMIRYVSDKRLELPIILIHSNRVPEEIPFGKERATLLSRIGNSKVIHTITSPKSRGSHGMVGKAGSTPNSSVRR